MFGRFMPREGRFFELFNAHAEQTVIGARSLRSLVEALGGEGGSVRGLVDEVSAIESRADTITRETVTLLHKTFITPLDRDEIHRLISRMDDILDLIESAALSLSVYDIRRATPELRQLVDIIVSCCDRVKSAVALVSDTGNIDGMLKTCAELSRLESDADRVMRNAIGRLFRDEQDMRELIRMKAIYEVLESVTDACQAVGNILEGIALENT
ncbi:DUF47 domain-containing protein [Cognatazoarcus halotolerans]|uniref:DUF47 domain-containing protein n=1 Tax=Cognatazoarcus halotolerans TaxID=2686016 RepID=UPI0013568749|nr:DUF47 family protein [Cognatazoarcus halotolerans]MBX3679191.1 DUF47 domain-containing protein [Rhodocyclaceae bacterium]MCB1899221.1 DUF47 domain-containing protein [Rhodocyclaceae bacterium]MCP5311001.1 DUF47 domain-containing protein [Zoogloeaceae bacterium]